MVEASITGIVVFFLFVMVFQSALFGRAFLAASDGARSGARAGAVAGNEPSSDYDILQAVNRAVSATSKSNVIAIVVFDPQGSTYSMPSGCLVAGISDVCNLYTVADLSRPVSDFGPGGVISNDDSWAAANRSVTRGATLDHLGVALKLKTGTSAILPGTTTKTSIVLLDPRF